MKVQLAYGSGTLEVELPGDRTSVIQPEHTPGLPDERGAVFAALNQPVGAAALKTWVKPGQRVCIAFTDITRATPNERLIPWLLEYLSDVPPGNITLLNGLGTHRPNTRTELERMLTPEVVRRYRVLNHEPRNPEALVQVGHTRAGTPALLNRHFVEADVRIVTGFIEPHFFAGFSGGPKGIMPGLAGLQTVMCNHGSRNIGSEQAVFGVTKGNPLWEELRDIALRAGPSFLVNVALNERRQITGVFAGDLIGAHAVGCEFVRRCAMQKVQAPFDVVVSTNSGYPLDLNLYQTVKGMSAGARVLKPGGLMVVASECREGVPAGCDYDRLLREADSAEELLARLNAPGVCRPEQWQAQIQAKIQRHARVQLYSSLTDETVRAAHLTPCRDISAAVQVELDRLPPAARVGVLPQGPLTIPYVGSSGWNGEIRAD